MKKPKPFIMTGKLILDLFDVLREHLPDADKATLYRQAQAFSKIATHAKKPRSREFPEGNVSQLLLYLQALVAKFGAPDKVMAYVQDVAASHSVEHLKQLLDEAWADLMTYRPEELKRK